MKKLAAMLTVWLLGAGAAQAQKAAPDPWAEYMTPAAAHRVLAGYTGEFVMEVSMWMDGKAAPTVAKVASSHRTLLGGRFLELKQRGNLMGMDYQAVMNLGFNTSSRQLTLTTMTNLGTGTVVLTGAWNAQAKAANLTGQMTDPVSKKPIRVRQKISFVDANTLLIENYDRTAGGPEHKSMQYRLVRKPKAG